MTEYTPGEWVAVVTDGAVALLPPTTTEPVVGRLWQSLRSADGAGVVDHLQVLVRDGLATLPPFALLTVDGARLHAVVRGAVEVEVTASGRTFVLTAPGVSTWSDEVVDGVEHVTVRVPGDEPAAGPGLPLVAGVARAGAVRLRVAARGTLPGTLPGSLPAGQPVRESAEPPAEALIDQSPVPAASAGLPTAPVPALVLAPAVPPAAPASPGSTSAVLPTPATAGDDVPDDEPVDLTVLRPSTASEPAGGTDPDDGTDPAAGTDPDDGTHAAPDTDTPVVDAPAHDAPASGVAPAVAAPGSTDHDGTTVLSADVVELRRRLPDWAGHSRTAAQPTPAAVPVTTAPVPARLALSTGERVTLTRPVLLGRAPQASRVHSSQVPQLVTVPSPLQDISRTHAEVRMDGDDVVLTDLRSTNGVLVVRPAATPQRLQPGEATVLQPGVLVDLGEGVTFTVERSA
ncbi:FHA domain-containing protein [uncultured Cellulomonas sp.]|uniref:FHA domain-containing protein n=1 Tax=uncultured Cellulomonas sp. TaxID=189682 RepID=UPI002631FF85|nr:FHA domain-containing protein [uncultured Cellulomonas sp.]